MAKRLERFQAVIAGVSADVVHIGGWDRQATRCTVAAQWFTGQHLGAQLLPAAPIEW